MIDWQAMMCCRKAACLFAVAALLTSGQLGFAKNGIASEDVAVASASPVTALKVPILESKNLNVANQTNLANAQTYKSTPALVFAAKEYLVRNLTNQTYQSYPVPVVESGSLKVTFMYGVSRAVPNEGRLLLPPHHIVLLDAQTGEVDSWKAVGPADFGQSHPANKEIGTFAMPQGVTYDEIIEKQNQLFALYDLLMPLFASKSALRTSELKTQATQFMKVFTEVSEPPLRAYYVAQGEPFFSWVRELTK